MTKGYFQRVCEQTKTRFWINNPTPEEAKKAIEAGAISCTTNPTYASKMIKTESEYASCLRIINESLQETGDETKAAVIAQRKIAKPILDRFLPLYEKNPGEKGFVSIQGDPYSDEDPDSIIHDALADMKLSKNVIPKIPVTEAGLKALEILIGMDIPVIATEIMAVSQAICVWEIYQRVSKKTGKTPPLYTTHITGIFDEYLKNVTARDGVDISKDLLWQAGCIIARKQYRILKERNYPGIMLGGGARGLHHFTEMVGPDMHITINWKGTADRLISEDPPVVRRMDTPIPEDVVEELIEKVPDFAKAYLQDGLEISEFQDFGPVIFFRNMFIKAWDHLLQTIRECRGESK